MATTHLAKPHTSRSRATRLLLACTVHDYMATSVGREFVGDLVTR